MGPNRDPVFTESSFSNGVTISVAEPMIDGSGSYSDLITGGALGSQIDKITIKASGPVTDGMIRFFIKGTGGDYRLWKEVPVTPPTTPDATTPAWGTEIDLSALPLRLVGAFVAGGSGVAEVLAVATENAETFNVFAHGGFY